MTGAENEAVRLDENDQIRVRREKREQLEAMGVAVYPSGYPVTHTAAAAVAAFRDDAEGPDCAVAGRLVAKRKMGKATFAHLQDRSGRVQIYFKRDVVGEEAYERLALLDLGDFLGVRGAMFRTRTGEVTVGAREWTLLGKALRPLPEKWHGLADKEARFRQRYLDLLVNEEARHIFQMRSRVIAALRRVLDEKGFLEVETPILQPLYGGAAARPFRTEHNALGLRLYMRIADELYLKRCLVGGIERVYEIGKDFRNEGMDRTHQPEFTQLEAYEAYASYREGMALVEELLAAAAEAATGSPRVEYEGVELDFGEPWERLAYFEALERETGKDLSDLAEGGIRDACRAAGLELTGEPTTAKLLDELFSKIVQPKLTRPTFVVDHPKIMAPLAKAKQGTEGLVERYEPIVAGLEIGNGYSELNDPVEQRARFAEQLRLADRDEDTMVLDEPFLRALEHGMPPAAGLGLGIDRIVMILTGAQHIREVILFPQMRPETGEGPTSTAAQEETS